VESHLRHIQFRKETRYPGFYYQADYPGQDDENWFCFVNSKYDPKGRNGMSSRKTTSRSSRINERNEPLALGMKTKPPGARRRLEVFINLAGNIRW
jgi:hypothetical protein